MNTAYSFCFCVMYTENILHDDIIRKRVNFLFDESTYFFFKYSRLVIYQNTEKQTAGNVYFYYLFLLNAFKLFHLMVIA